MASILDRIKAQTEEKKATQQAAAAEAQAAAHAVAQKQVLHDKVRNALRLSTDQHAALAASHRETLSGMVAQNKERVGAAVGEVKRTLREAVVIGIDVPADDAHGARIDAIKGGTVSGLKAQRDEMRAAGAESAASGEIERDLESLTPDELNEVDKAVETKKSGILGRVAAVLRERKHATAAQEKTHQEQMKKDRERNVRETRGMLDALSRKTENQKLRYRLLSANLCVYTMPDADVQRLQTVLRSGESAEKVRDVFNEIMTAKKERMPAEMDQLEADVAAFKQELEQSEPIDEVRIQQEKDRALNGLAQLFQHLKNRPGGKLFIDSIRLSRVDWSNKYERTYKPASDTELADLSKLMTEFRDENNIAVTQFGLRFQYLSYTMGRAFSDGSIPTKQNEEKFRNKEGKPGDYLAYLLKYQLRDTYGEARVQYNEMLQKFSRLRDLNDSEGGRNFRYENDGSLPTDGAYDTQRNIEVYRELSSVRGLLDQKYYAQHRAMVDAVMKDFEGSDAGKLYHELFEV